MNSVAHAPDLSGPDIAIEAEKRRCKRSDAIGALVDGRLEDQLESIGVAGIASISSASARAVVAASRRPADPVGGSRRSSMPPAVR